MIALPQDLIPVQSLTATWFGDWALAKLAPFSAPTPTLYVQHKFQGKWEPKLEVFHATLSRHFLS
jgi:hypothetical protein